MEAMEEYGIVLVFAVVMLGGQYIGQFIGSTQQAILQVYGAIFGVVV